jgi:hypothetical protein
MGSDANSLDPNGGKIGSDSNFLDPNQWFSIRPESPGSLPVRDTDRTAISATPAIMGSSTFQVDLSTCPAGLPII